MSKRYDDTLVRHLTVLERSYQENEKVQQILRYVEKSLDNSLCSYTTKIVNKKLVHFRSFTLYSTDASNLQVSGLLYKLTTEFGAYIQNAYWDKEENAFYVEIDGEVFK